MVIYVSSKFIALVKIKDFVDGINLIILAIANVRNSLQANFVKTLTNVILHVRIMVY